MLVSDTIVEVRVALRSPFRIVAMAPPGQMTLPIRRYPDFVPGRTVQPVDQRGHRFGRVMGCAVVGAVALLTLAGSAAAQEASAVTRASSTGRSPGAVLWSSTFSGLDG